MTCKFFFHTILFQFTISVFFFYKFFYPDGNSRRGEKGVKEVDGEYRYFSQLRASHYQRTWKSGATSK